MKGKYVIVRCKDAGVHAGYLKKWKGREVHLKKSRRLWYWKCKQGAFLSAVAKYGLGEASKVGTPVKLVLLEACEIVECTPAAAESIIRLTSHNE